MKDRSQQYLIARSDLLTYQLLYVNLFFTKNPGRGEEGERAVWEGCFFLKMQAPFPACSPAISELVSKMIFINRLTVQRDCLYYPATNLSNSST